MRNQSPQPSQIIFPVALQPIQWEEEAPQTKDEPWGWLEVFVILQVFWGVILFLPGSQTYRTYIRALPYVVSLIALASCVPKGMAGSFAPGARLVLLSLFMLIASLLHPASWVLAGIAQVVFQLSIAAPIFWAVSVWTPRTRLERLIWLVFAAYFASAAVGLLQVYYPETFSPPELSSLGLKMNPYWADELSYMGAGDRIILRPPGLSDLPGGAAIAGVIAALIGFAMAIRGDQTPGRRAFYFGAVVIAITVVYLTQVRAMLLMLIACMQALAWVSLRQGRVIKGGWIAVGAATLVVGAFLWAVTLGGDALTERFRGIMDEGLVETYQQNRGGFLSYTFRDLLPQYPFGAGIGRWGMMSVYFEEPGNWQYPSLHAEIQLTGWLYDAGVLLWAAYGAALFAAVRNSYRVAISPNHPLQDIAGIVFSVQVLIVGLCFTGPAFNTQLGILFWLLTAILFAAQRTRHAEEAYDASVEAESESGLHAEASQPAAS